MTAKQIADLTLQDILVRKSEARRDLARMSFGQKAAIVEQMRERLAPFNALRRKRQQGNHLHAG